MVSKNLSGIKDLTGLALPILGLPKCLILRVTTIRLQIFIANLL